jgi:GNAT superfamily N-acetyltransferase
MSVEIRQAGPDDVETFFTIQRTTSLAAFAHIFPPDRYPFPDADVRERWRRYLGEPEGTALLAEGERGPVGMTAFLPGQLYALYVLPDEWGSRVGSSLHDAAVAGLRELGPEARLWVLEANTRARRFYERRGWRLDGRERVVPFPPHPLDVGYSLPLR